MKPIYMEISGNSVAVTGADTLVAGTVGLQVQVSFDSTWDKLEKTAVFRANGKTMDCIRITDQAVIPWELLQTPGCHLWAGIYGSGENGRIQIPTIWADLGCIQKGADPSGDESAEPSKPIWQQLSDEVEAALEEIIRYQNQIVNGEIVVTGISDGGDTV